MYKISTLNKISSKGLKLFPSDSYQITDQLAEGHAVLLRSFSLHDSKFDEKLLAVGRAGAGVNNIPIETLSEMGVCVFNTPGANANAVKELVLAAMLAVSRNICPANSYLKHLSDKSADLKTYIETCKKQFVGNELAGQTLGVIGLGAIGGMLANSARSLGMNVIGYDPVLNVKAAHALSSKVTITQYLDELLAQSDFISVHVPLVPSTKNMIDAKAMQKLKPSVVLLNFSRSGIIDESALISNLKEKKISGYATDFPSYDLLALDNVLGLPHLGASTEQAEEACAVMVSKQVISFLENGNICNSVNYPTIELPRQGQSRLICMHKANPDLVAQATASLSNLGYSVVQASQQTQGKYAITLIDVAQKVSADHQKTLSSLDSILKLRVV